MCGICGVVSLNNSSGNSFISAVEKMASAMKHRGPDDSNIEVLGNACFGHRRLSILDTSANGRQPFISEDSSVGMIVNGEIYNYNSLREQLIVQGAKFYSKSDSEVILQAYLMQGADFVTSLRGMFAYAIHDKKISTTIIARDRQGIKPIYYYVNDDILIFSSEINSLLESGLVERQIDPMALKNYVQLGYMSEPNTLVKNVKILEPGCQLILSNSKIVINPYWAAPDQKKQFESHAKILEKTSFLLKDSIDVHLQSDVPVGVFLSGGIDSTVITALASKFMKNPIKTFSLGFKTNDGKLDETEIASEVSKYFETCHHEIIISGQDVLNNLDDIIGSMSQPSFDGINTYFVSKAASESGVKVVLSGLGGDELFGGYASYNVLPRAGSVLKIWLRINTKWRDFILSFLQKILNRKRYAAKILRLANVKNFIDLYLVLRSNCSFEESDNAFSSNFKRKIGKSLEYNNSSILKTGKNYNDLWRETQRLEIKNYMQWRLLRDSDAMSMAHSLELRVPLIDDFIVENVLSLYSGWHKKLGWPKKLLVKSMDGLIPDFVLNQKKKGFELPMKYWMKNELEPIINDVFSSSSIKNRGIFNEEYMFELYDNFKRGGLPYEQIWKYVVLELWIRKLNLKN